MIDRENYYLLPALSYAGDLTIGTENRTLGTLCHPALSYYGH